MNILHLVESYLPVTESWIYPQIKGDGSWHSAVASIHRSEATYYPYPDVTSFSERWSCWKQGRLKGIVYRFPQIAMLWFRFKFKPGAMDIVHCHFGDLAYYALPLTRHLKTRQITMFYGYDATMLPAQKPVWRKRYQRLFAQGDLFLVEGNNMKRTLAALGCPESKIIIFHLGVDLDRLPFQERSLRNGEPLRLLAAGSFREKKGISYAVEAFARAKKEFPIMTLTIIGDAVGKELEEKERILATVSSCGLAESVHFLGFQPHERFLEELGKHHVFISPSVVAVNGDTEGGAPVAITEASAAGLPVISTVHCDIPEVVLNNVSGRLTQERDVAGLADSILLFARNPQLLGEYGRKGRQHIEEHYNITRQLKALSGIYTQLASGQLKNREKVI